MIQLCQYTKEKGFEFMEMDRISLAYYRMDGYGLDEVRLEYQDVAYDSAEHTDREMKIKLQRALLEEYNRQLVELQHNIYHLESMEI